MTERPRITAQRRSVVGKAVQRLRRAGRLPAVVYGHDVPSVAVDLDAHEFDLLRRRIAATTLIDLSVDGERPRPVLLHHVQEHPVGRHPIHADLLVVRMSEELTMDVPITLVGSSEVVERQGGILLHLRDTVHLRARPGDLPQSLEVDLAALDSFQAVLHVSDIALPPHVTMLTDPAEPVVRVQPPQIQPEDVEPPAAEVPEAEAPDADVQVDIQAGEDAS